MEEIVAESTVLVLEHDTWVRKPSASVVEGDYIAVDGEITIVRAEGRRSEPSIQLVIDDTPLTRVMDELLADVLVFDDGTQLLYNGTTFLSPRLPESALTTFCETHATRYSDLSGAVYRDILSEEKLPRWTDHLRFTPWWENIS